MGGSDHGALSAVLAVGMTAVSAALVLSSCVTVEPPPPPPRLAVMSWNVGDAVGIVPPLEGVVGVLAAAGWKDVYLLQEVLTGDRASRLVAAIAAAGGGAYHLAYDRGQRVAMLSREPLGPPEAFVAPSSALGRGAFVAKTLVAGRAVTLVDIHLDPIPKPRDSSGRVSLGLLSAIGAVLREMSWKSPRSESVAEILRWLDGRDAGPMVVGGDFNTVPSSAAIRLMSDRFVDAAAAAGRSLSGTYWRVRLPFRPRVDYIFVSSGISVVDARTVRRTAGDHYPVVAVLELPPP
jgi:endonuclease/exonuclease/phosphatase family metal-dependent hydrolase